MAIAGVAMIGVGVVVSVAVAERADTNARIEVSAANTTRLPPDSTTTTTTSLPAGRGPLPGGTYSGVEHFALFTGRCSFLDHHIVGTFSPSDGTTWTFHQDYCGTLKGDLWSAEGTFALTAPDGAMITGTVTETDIRVPSPGVPYTIDVTGGTQRFAGATGTCRLDNHLRVIQFGLQDDFGAFTCDIGVGRIVQVRQAR